MIFRILSVLQSWRGVCVLLLLMSAAPLPASASGHYTAKQLEVLAQRVGKTYWLNSEDNRSLSFLSAPAATARTFEANPYESFEIIELTGRKSRNPYYKVRLESGREGFIRPDHFLEHLNIAIVSVDPRADEKRRETAAAEEEKKRLAWIEAQPWSQAVKEAAAQKQPVIGMSTGEITKVLGSPTRAQKFRGAQRFNEEHWLYANGDVLVFQNGLLKEARKSDPSVK